MLRAYLCHQVPYFTLSINFCTIECPITIRKPDFSLSSGPLHFYHHIFAPSSVHCTVCAIFCTFKHSIVLSKNNLIDCEIRFHKFSLVWCKGYFVSGRTNLWFIFQQRMETILSQTQLMNLRYKNYQIPLDTHHGIYVFRYILNLDNIDLILRFRVYLATQMQSHL